jgi:hypothetical protein
LGLYKMTTQTPGFTRSYHKVTPRVFQLET